MARREHAHQDMPDRKAEYEVVRDLTRKGRRSTVSLIRYRRGEYAVKKQFKTGCERAFRRELTALQQLAEIDDYDIIPSILEVGPDYFIIPYYTDSLRRDSFLFRCGLRLMPLRVVRRVFAALRCFYEHGYEILDVHPENILVDKAHGVTIIDLEFAYPGAADPNVPFEESQTVLGPLPDFEHGLNYHGRRYYYDVHWELAAGLPPRSLIHDPLWLQYLKRIVFVPIYTWPAFWKRRYVPRTAVIKLVKRIIRREDATEQL